MRIGDEFIGVLDRDDEDGGVCYSLSIAILEEDLPARAALSGARFAELLARRLPSEEIVAIRQIGLLLGVEMRSPKLVERFTRECRREGLILGWTLHDDRVVRLAPPLVIRDAELDEASLRMERAAARAIARRVNGG